MTVGTRVLNVNLSKKVRTARIVCFLFFILNGLASFLYRAISSSVTKRPSPTRHVHRWRIVGRPPDVEGYLRNKRACWTQFNKQSRTSMCLCWRVPQQTRATINPSYGVGSPEKQSPRCSPCRKHTHTHTHPVLPVQKTHTHTHTVPPGLDPHSEKGFPAPFSKGRMS